MVVGSGSCQFCEKCAFITKEPSRHEDKALWFLEANCANVNALAGISNLKYINVPNTVTIFGALLFNL
jgi:predicted metal-binding protein